MKYPHEFPVRDVPAVMRGPRRERRRVLVGNTPCWGTVHGEGELLLDDGRSVALEGLVHLPPASPSKIIAVHLSYTSRGVETRDNPHPTKTPTYFTKPPTALTGHQGEIVKPADCAFLNYEGEFAVVIGRVCRNVTPDEAWDYIEGFVPALDMGLQNFRDTDQGSMLRVKGADGLLPLGPGIVSGIDIFAQQLTTYVNGQVVQQAHIGHEMIWGPHYMVADVARHITLMPGDLLLTGTPCHSRSVGPGDLVEVEITGLGRLAARVTEGLVPRASLLGVGHEPTDSPEVRRVALGFDERVPQHLRDGLARARADKKA